jgi:two-component system, cell cycle response regulator
MNGASLLVAISGFSPMETRLIEGILKVSASRPHRYLRWDEASGEAPDFYLLRQAHAEARGDWERWTSRYENPRAPLLLIGSEETSDCRILTQRLGREVPYITKPIVALRLLEAMDQAVELAHQAEASGIRDDISLDELHRLAQHAGPAQLAAQAQRGVVLVVDDSASVRMQMDLFLQKRHGLRADYAADGRSALRKLETRDYGLIFLDVMLPDIEGFEVCRTIKRELRRSIPVVLMTSRNSKRDRMRGVLVEADDYLVKPVQLEALDAVLGKYLFR